MEFSQRYGGKEKNALSAHRRAVVITTFPGGMQQNHFVGVPNTFFILGLVSIGEVILHPQQNGNIATMAAQVDCGNNVVNCATFFVKREIG